MIGLSVICKQTYTETTPGVGWKLLWRHSVTEWSTSGEQKWPSACPVRSAQESRTGRPKLFYGTVLSLVPPTLDWVGLREISSMTLQRVCLKIKLQWQHIILKYNLYKKPAYEQCRMNPVLLLDKGPGRSQASTSTCLLTATPRNSNHAKVFKTEGFKLD